MGVVRDRDMSSRRGRGGGIGGLREVRGVKRATEPAL